MEGQRGFQVNTIEYFEGLYRASRAGILLDNGHK